MVLTRLSTSWGLKRFKRVSDCILPCSHRSEYSSSACSPTVKDQKAKQIFRKKYSELPVTYISPTGVPAAPLGEWFAGSDDPFPSKIFQPTIFQENLASSECPTEKSAEKKGKRKKGSKLTQHNDLTSPESLTEDLTEKVKRKKRAELTQDNDLASPESPAEILTEKKAKRKKRAELTRDSDGQETKIVRTKRSKGKIQESIAGEPQLQLNESASTDDWTLRDTAGLTRVSPTIKPIKAGGFLAQEIIGNLKRFPHCLLLTRVGQFYESYFDQAVEISRLLNIKLTSRKLHGKRVAMCGFPLIHLDRHLKTLVQHERRFVAMCEEFPRYIRPTVKEFDRRVNRVITPGTLIDESFLNPLENNYLVAISLSTLDDTKIPVGLAWIDVSTGEFFSETCTLESLPDELARLAPREIVLDNVFKTRGNHPFFKSLAEDCCVVSYTSSTHIADPDKGENSTMASSADSLTTRDLNKGRLTDPDSSVKQYIANLSNHVYAGGLAPEETSAVNLLTLYLEETMLEHMPLLTSPSREGVQERMQIDAHTIKGLEIRESVYDGGTKGSLLNVVKRTVTSGGTRLLARWLCSPSTSITEINARQSLVAFFSRRPHLCADISEILKRVDDVGRLCQKFLLGRADFTDLGAIHASIEIWANLGKHFQQEKAAESVEQGAFFLLEEWRALDTLFSQMSNLDTLSNRISKAVFPDSDNAKACDADEDEHIEDETALQSLFPDKSDYKWVINPNFSEKLSSLHTIFESLLQQKEKLERELQLTYDAPSLTLRSSPGQGMFVHLAKAKRDKKLLDLDSTFHSLSATGTTKNYFYQPWSELGNKLAEMSVALTLAEKEVLQMLRLEIIQHSNQLRQNAQVIDELDVLLSFAALAAEMNFVRPIITDNDSYNVINGRHPSVEMGLLSSGRQFIPNSVEMTSSSNLHIITGPNMAGKSTFLRQTALIAILAQVGSFVPADSAQIGVVDRLFSRIGAKDDLFRDRSTFMVEMIETADILRRATPKSLVIMDEVGRGTTVKDGLAISFATLHHLATINKSRCLFATHFHELANMVGSDNESGQGFFHNIRFYCSDINDTEDGHFTYSYRLRPGVNRNSHGLKVAQLAGMPPAAMTVAAETLSQLKDNIPNHD